MNIEGSSVLLTGASAGIGWEMARQLGHRASSIVLVARRRERLEQLRAELLQRNPNLRVHVHVADLADAAQLNRLLEWLEQEKIEIDFLINNAGLGDMGLFSTSDPGRVARMVQVNILALTLLTRRLVPAMIKKRRGAILNVSSSAGFLPIADFSVYAATKAYVNSFSEGLRIELRPHGISVCALCPGPVHTEFTLVAQRPNEPPLPTGSEIVYVPVEEVAAAGLRAVAEDRPLVIPGWVMKIGMALGRAMPLAVLRWAGVRRTKDPMLAEG